MRSYLILGALKIELSGLLGLFTVKQKRKIGHILVYCCDYKGRNVWVALTGMGEKGARDAANHLSGMIQDAQVSALAMVGLCGATDPQLAIGEVGVYTSLKRLEKKGENMICHGMLKTAVPKHVSCRGLQAATVNVLAHTQTLKADIYEKFGVQAVDMESYYICREALKRQIPPAVIRAVSDTAGQNLPSFMVDFSENRRLAGLLKLIRVMFRPSCIKNAIIVFRNTKLAASNLTEAVRQWVLQ